MTFLYISSMALWIAVAATTLALEKVLVMTLALHPFRDNSSQRPLNGAIPVGGAISPFQAALLDEPRIFTSADLEGDASLLLFLEAANVSPDSTMGLATMIHALWHKAPGRLWIVCIGSAEQCSQKLLAAVQASHVQRAPIVIDNDGAITRSFGIYQTPVAVSLDCEARVVRYGYQLSLSVEGRSRNSKDVVGHANREAPSSGPSNI